jgi:hypothetical protein
VSDLLWPRDVVAYLVVQRRVRAAARELRAATRAAPTPMKPTVVGVLDTLASLDEAIDAALDRTGEADAPEPDDQGGAPEGGA